MNDSRSSGFAHERLDAYHIAQALVQRTVELTAELPRGFADVRDQARRSALATVRHIAEGAARESHKDKKARFVVARGEVAELDATLASAALVGLVPESPCADARILASRVAAMLTGLIKRERKLVDGHSLPASEGLAVRACEGPP